MSYQKLPVRPTSILAVGAILLAGCAGGGDVRPAERVPAYPVDEALLREVPNGFPLTCPSDAVQVMLLGTFHFQGSATDAVSGTPADVTTPRRQAELDELVTRLARWEPQQVAVEWPYSFADSTTARYQRYLAGDGQSASQNEVVQVGFRLARLLGHPTVHPIDHQMPIGNDSIGTLLRRRPDLRRNRDRLIRELRSATAAREREEMDLPMVERLRLVNEEEALRAGNSRAMFGSWIAAGEGENRGGPQLLARWYERNFYMAHNLTRVVRPDTRRVLLLVGSGHVPALRNILDEAPGFCPVSPLATLR